jgi:hypothetical protein
MRRIELGTSSAAAADNRFIVVTFDLPVFLCGTPNVSDF